MHREVMRRKKERAEFLDRILTPQIKVLPWYTRVFYGLRGKREGKEQWRIIIGKIRRRNPDPRSRMKMSGNFLERGVPLRQKKRDVPMKSRGGKCPASCPAEVIASHRGMAQIWHR